MSLAYLIISLVLIILGVLGFSTSLVFMEDGNSFKFNLINIIGYFLFAISTAITTIGFFMYIAWIWNANFVVIKGG
jgi:hypothetical protein